MIWSCMTYASLVIFSYLVWFLWSQCLETDVGLVYEYGYYILESLWSPDPLGTGSVSYFWLCQYWAFVYFPYFQYWLWYVENCSSCPGSYFCEIFYCLWSIVLYWLLSTWDQGHFIIIFQLWPCLDKSEL